MATDYKILERNGKFLVGVVQVKNRVFSMNHFWEPYEKFHCIYMGLHRPAHFKTLKKARKYVKKITKPDTYHTLKKS